MAGDPVAEVAEEERAPQLTTEYLARQFAKHAQTLPCKSEFMWVPYIELCIYIYIFIDLYHFVS